MLSDIYLTPTCVQKIIANSKTHRSICTQRAAIYDYYLSQRNVDINMADLHLRLKWGKVVDSKMNFGSILKLGNQSLSVQRIGWEDLKFSRFSSIQLSSNDYQKLNSAVVLFGNRIIEKYFCS